MQIFPQSPKINHLTSCIDSIILHRLLHSEINQIDLPDRWFQLCFCLFNTGEKNKKETFDLQWGLDKYLETFF